MNITSLKIKNFLSLVDVEIKPGKITQIVGCNGEGKTSILKAVDFAVHGSKDQSLVRLGEDSAEVLIELSDATVIRRRLTSEGRQSVEVSREGMKATSPQALLNALFDQSSFNPLELLSEEKRHDAIMSSITLQIDAKTLAEALGIKESELPELDYTMHGLKVLDICYRYFYQRRAEANKEASEKKKRWETYRVDFKEVEAPVITRKEIEAKRQDLISEISSAQNKAQNLKTIEDENKKLSEKIASYEKAQKDIWANMQALETTKTEIEKDLIIKLATLKSDYELLVNKAKHESAAKEIELKEKISAGQARIESAHNFIQEAKASLKNDLESDSVYLKQKSDAEQALEQLKTAEKTIEAYEATEKSRSMIESMEGEFRTSEAFAKELDKRVSLLNDQIKKDLMSKAEMPIEGLQYINDQFLINGVSVDNLNTAAKVKLAVSVARHKAKKTKIICIDGAESLDETTWQAFLEETKDDGFSYFVTKVGAAHSDLTSTVIQMEKGHILQ